MSNLSLIRIECFLHFLFHLYRKTIKTVSLLLPYQFFYFVFCLWQTKKLFFFYPLHQIHGKHLCCYLLGIKNGIIHKEFIIIQNGIILHSWLIPESKTIWLRPGLSLQITFLRQSVTIISLRLIDTSLALYSLIQWQKLILFPVFWSFSYTILTQVQRIKLIIILRTRHTINMDAKYHAYFFPF